MTNHLQEAASHLRAAAASLYEGMNDFTESGDYGTVSEYAEMVGQIKATTLWGMYRTNWAAHAYHTKYGFLARVLQGTDGDWVAECSHYHDTHDEAAACSNTMLDALRSGRPLPDVSMRDFRDGNQR